MGKVLESSLPSPIGDLYWFGAVSGFTSNPAGAWHSIRVYDSSDNGGILVVGEYTSGNLNRSVTICQGLSSGTFYTSEIYWNSTAGGWLYKSSACNTTLLVTESPTPETIKTSGGLASIDMMESSDFVAADFGGLASYVHFNPSLEYLNAGSWVAATQANSLDTNAVSSIGMVHVCDPPLEIVVDCTYAPPSTTNSYNTNCGS